MCLMTDDKAPSASSAEGLAEVVGKYVRVLREGALYFPEVHGTLTAVEAEEFIIDNDGTRHLVPADEVSGWEVLGDPAPGGGYFSRQEAAEPQTAPACDGCGEVAWKVDADITNRASIMVGSAFRTDVLVDRAGPEDSGIETVGGIQCTRCGLDLLEHEPAYEHVARMAARLVEHHDSRWGVITDYRQF